MSCGARGTPENGRLGVRKAGREGGVLEQGTGRALWSHTWPGGPGIRCEHHSGQHVSSQ